MKLDIQSKWNLYYDVARFLVLNGGKQIDYAGDDFKNINWREFGRTRNTCSKLTSGK